MTDTKRWLDELPLGSRERELLLVGKAARPEAGAIEANWRALCAALGTTAAISGTFATSAAASSAGASASASANVGASVAAGKATSAGLFIAATKSLVLGAGIGLAVMGAASVVEHSGDNHAPLASALKPPQKTSAPQQLHPAPLPNLVQPDPSTAAAPVSPPSNMGTARIREPAAVSASNPNLPNLPQAAPSPSAISAEEKTASLARQARELAELKRLIDQGASSEALARLDKNFSAGTPSALSEERDALYVQALARAQRRSEAQAFARQFMIRYPHSPYFETMRQLLNDR